MFIKDGKRINIHSPFFDAERKRTADFTKADEREAYGVTEIADPERMPDETHYNQEIDEAPYLVSTPKPAKQIAEATNAKVQGMIDALELKQLMPRGSRDMFKGILEEKAASLGMTNEQLYAANIGYKKLIDLDTEIANLRTGFVEVPAEEPV